MTEAITSRAPKIDGRGERAPPRGVHPRKPMTGRIRSPVRVPRTHHPSRRRSAPACTSASLAEPAHASEPDEGGGDRDHGRRRRAVRCRGECDAERQPAGRADGTRRRRRASDARAAGRPQRVRCVADRGAADGVRGCSRAKAPTELRAVVLAGDGPSFCAGADIDWMRAAMALDTEGNEQDAMAMADMFETIDTCPVPVIARVQGAALGGGMGLCAVADLVIAESGTRFGFTETRLGILPSVISPFVIAKIGESHARALFPGGRRFDATRAAADRAGPRDRRGRGGARRRGRRGGRGPARCRPDRGARRQGDRPRGPRPGPRIGEVAHGRVIARQRTSEEAQEGFRAFTEKRRPAWAPDQPTELTDGLRRRRSYMRRSRHDARRTEPERGRDAARRRQRGRSSAGSRAVGCRRDALVADGVSRLTRLTRSSAAARPRRRAPADRTSPDPDASSSPTAARSPTGSPGPCDRLGIRAVVPAHGRPGRRSTCSTSTRSSRRPRWRRRRRPPPRLRVPRRERRLRRGGRWRPGSAGSGRRRRRSGRWATRPPPAGSRPSLGVPVLRRLRRRRTSPTPRSPRRPSEIGFPLLVKPAAGGGGKGMRTVREPRAARRRARRRPARGDGRVRRRPADPRAARRGRAPRRDPGPVRRARHGRPPRRARLLDPAPAPEGPRGDAVAGRRRRRSARGSGEAALTPRPRGRLRERRHVRVPASTTAAARPSSR